METNAISDMKSMGNDLITNAIAYGIYDKLLKAHVANPADSELLNLLKVSAVITSIEELKRVLGRAGYSTRIF